VVDYGREEGGVVLDGIHELDYLSWFFGEITQLFGDVSRISSLEIEADDYAAITAKHNTGVRSEIHLDYLRRFKRRGCEIAGTEGIIDWASEGKFPERCLVKIYSPRSGWKIILDEQKVNAVEPLNKMMKEYIKALNGESNILQTGDHALHLLSNVLSLRSKNNA